MKSILISLVIIKAFHSDNLNTNWRILDLYYKGYIKENDIYEIAHRFEYMHEHPMGSLGNLKACTFIRALLWGIDPYKERLWLRQYENMIELKINTNDDGNPLYFKSRFI